MGSVIELPTESDPVRLIQGDCLEVMRRMPDGCVDAVVTSPPYNQLGNRVPSSPSGIHSRNGFLRSVNQVGYPDDMPEPDYQVWLRSVVAECLRVARGLVWVNHKTRFRDGSGIHPLHFLPFPVYAEVVWDRGGSMALNCRRFAPSHELVYGFGRPHWWNDSANSSLSVWRISPHRERDGMGHPCPFPIELPRRLIRASVPPGGIVLDCFGGSGTTAAAAMREGRRSVLVERDPTYCDIIRGRLDRISGTGAGSLFAETDL